MISFWLPNMTICKHVHRLELQKFFNFSAAHSLFRLGIETKFLICNYWQPCQKLEIREFRLYISSLTGECAAGKFKNLCSSSLWTCLHHMVILKSQNKITDFFMILAWASPFNRFKFSPTWSLFELRPNICKSWRLNTHSFPITVI